MADLVMVGAGPQALALSCLLLQKRSRLHRRLRIVDPSGRWLSRWQRQMERYEIPWLRSPSPHHPHPSAHALRRFAHNQQRHRQLEGRYGLPHTDLFAAFCREVISEFALEGRVQAASIEHISLPANGKDPLELSLSDGTTVQAGRVVIATGNGTPQWPTWIKAIAGKDPEDALQHSDAIDLPALRLRPGERILIVGGGLTSAHLSLGALRPLRPGGRGRLRAARRHRQKRRHAEGEAGHETTTGQERDDASHAETPGDRGHVRMTPPTGPPSSPTPERSASPDDPWRRSRGPKPAPRFRSGQLCGSGASPIKPATASKCWSYAMIRQPFPSAAAAIQMSFVGMGVPCCLSETTIAVYR